MIRTQEALDGQVLHLTLDRPKANILDEAMIGGMMAALDTVKADTRLIVFEGAGDHFSFGASVEEHQADRVASMFEAFHGLFRRLAALCVPTCAAVRGQCLGGGLELAAWCTWLVATPSARLGQPEIALGVFPPMASLLLPWRLGGAAALDLCVSGRTWTADEAHRRGLVHVVTEDLSSFWGSLVEERFGKTSAASLRLAERAARLDLLDRLESHLPRLEQLYLSELMKSHDAEEGIAAFLQRRPPVWTHA